MAPMKVRTGAAIDGQAILRKALGGKLSGNGLMLRSLRGFASSSGITKPPGDNYVRLDNGSRPSLPSVDYVPPLEMPAGVPIVNSDFKGSSGKTVAVFGATGFLGGFVVSRLAAAGHRIIAATRGDDMSWRHLKTCADYGKLVPSYISMNDDESVRETIQGCDIVVNVMGKYYETKHFLPNIINCSYEDVHIKAAEKVARIAREENVKHLVHVSCAYANEHSPSRWASSKAIGEKRVLEQFPGAAIVRPNMCYGETDRFLTFLAFCAQSSPYIPIVDGGQSTMLPVFVGDAGAGIATIASTYHTAGQVFNLSGDNEYTWKEVCEYVLEQTKRPAQLLDVPLKTAMFGSSLVNLLPKPWFAPEEVLGWEGGAPGPGENEKTFADLGIKPASFEIRAHQFLLRFVPGGHFAHEREFRHSTH